MKKSKFKMVSERTKKHASKRHLYIVMLMLVGIALLLYNIYNKEEKYLVNEGQIEYTTSCTGYVIKNETIIDLDKNKVIIPTVSEGSRVSKNNTIATYREAEYQEYQQKIEQLDKSILDAMKDINVEYSIDVSNLETQALNMVVAAEGSTSVIDMQEVKSNINNILSKRASIIGDLVPEDAYVKELIEERENLERLLTTSSANIKAPIGGIISYSTDGLEEKLTEKTAYELNYEDVKEVVNNAESSSSNSIRITSNYEAFIYVRVDNIDSDLIDKEKNYDLKIMGAELVTLKGNIVKTTETEQGYEILFRITNGVENIVDVRQCDLEVVWTTYEGLIVPIKAITQDESGKSFVKIITRGEYVDIPVKIEQQNKTYAIVSNYEKENINSYILERYDQVVIFDN